MRIPLGLIFILALAVGLALLAPDSKLGGDLRNTGSNLRQGTSSIFDTLGRGSRDLGEAVSE
jgi:hypothetical protein